MSFRFWTLGHRGAGKKISIVLYALIGLEAIVKITLTIYVILNEGSKLFSFYMCYCFCWLIVVIIAGLAKDVTTCASNNEPRPLLFIIDWSVKSFSNHYIIHPLYRGIPLAYGLLLLVLALIKAIEYWRLNTYNGSRLVKVLITDQIMYFSALVSFPLSSPHWPNSGKKSYNKFGFRTIERSRPNIKFLSTDSVIRCRKSHVALHPRQPFVLQSQRSRWSWSQWRDERRLLSKPPYHQQHSFRRTQPHPCHPWNQSVIARNYF